MSEFNLLEAIDWQRSKAETLIKMIRLKQEWYRENFKDACIDWFRDVFNLGTANDFGLEVWSLILDTKLYGYLPSATEGYPAFGFGAQGGFKNFNRGSFASTSSSTYALTTEQKRIALKLKAYIIFMDGSARGINKSLASIFGKNQLYVVDNFDMSITYVTHNKYTFGLTKQLGTMGLLPRPAGVGIRGIYLKESNIFGFGSKFNNFGEGRFKNV